MVQHNTKLERGMKYTHVTNATLSVQDSQALNFTPLYTQNATSTETEKHLTLFLCIGFLSQLELTS